MDTQFPQRKRTRWEGFDYNSAGAYFITICTQNRLQLLSQIVGGDVLDAPDSVGGDVLCQQQDCKQLCKRIVNTFASCEKRIRKPNGA